MLPSVQNAIRRSLTRTQLIWLIAAIFFVGIYTFFASVIFPQWHRYERIVHAGAQTSGTIIAKEPENHASIRYAYTVAGARYEGIGASGWGGIPSLERVQLGQTIPIAYWMEQPAVSLPGDPREMYESWCGALFLVAPFMSLLGAAITILRIRKRVIRFMEPAHT
jgi:hypothetical protein